jgi:beta-glucanase (GH16 family)
LADSPVGSPKALLSADALENSVPMKRNLVPFAMVLIGLTVVAAFVSAAPVSTATKATMPAPGQLVWSDEFDGVAGSAPDQAKWRQETGGSGWGNGELQYYTDSTRNASLDGDGNLAITARQENPAGTTCQYGPCEYTSARLLSVPQLSRAYGRFEARLKVPQGQGFWPAFWLLGDNVQTDGWPASGEIDVMEHVGQEPLRVFGSLHGPGYSGKNSVTGNYSLPGQQNASDAFHVFTLDWAPNSVTWYVDGIQYLHKTRGDIRGNPWVFDHKFFLLLNLAVGGVWPGPPEKSTVFPQAMLVDYVRVYELAGLQDLTSHRIQGLAGKCINVEGGAALAGARLVLRDCEAADSAYWTFEVDGTARSSGLCMEVAGLSAAATSADNGAVLQLADCQTGPHQQFQLNDAGDLVNLRTGKCADVTGWNPNNGARLQLWDCAGSVNQKWWRLT